MVTATAVADATKSAPPAPVTVSLANPVSVTITPTSASAALGAITQYSAKVQNVSDQVVVWSVNGVPGGNSTVGTITPGGLYTAPLLLPNPAVVTIAAAADADSSKSSSVLETLIPPVVITISPKATPTIDLLPGQVENFSAAVLNTSNTAVTWTLKGTGCSGLACGQLSSGGTYTAPATLTAAATDTVVATSVADPTKFASQNVLDYLPPQIVAAQGSSFTETVTAGQSITFYLVVTGGTGDPNQPLSITCDPRFLPTGTTCTPASLTPTGVSTIFPITITTTAPPPPTSANMDRLHAATLALLLPFGGLFLIGRARRRSIGLVLLLSIAALYGSLGLIGCGTGGTFNQTTAKSFSSTPVGSFAIQLNGSVPGGAQQPIATINLVVQ